MRRVKSQEPGYTYHLLCLLPATDKCPTCTRYVTSEVFKNATTTKELKSFLFLQETEEEKDKQAGDIFPVEIHLNERKLKPSLELSTRPSSSYPLWPTQSHHYDILHKSEVHFSPFTHLCHLAETACTWVSNDASVAVYISCH